MNRIKKLRYAGVIAGVGLAVVMFSNGVYANTSPKETQEETEVAVISFDFSENTDESEEKTGDEASTMNESDDENAGDEDMDLAAGAGEVLENIEDNSEILGRSAGAGDRKSVV